MLLNIRLVTLAMFFPVVGTISNKQTFPDITFKAFNEFVENTFSSKVTLATVLAVLFSLTESIDLLNLHSRQRNPVSRSANGWIRALSRALIHQLDDQAATLFFTTEFPQTRLKQSAVLSGKLDAFAELLRLIPHEHRSVEKTKTLPVSYDLISAVQVICPAITECVNRNCHSRALLQTTQIPQIPLATLIKNNTVYKDVPVLVGKCKTCSTTYHADHTRFKDRFDLWNKSYLNSASFLKVGQSTWVDQKFGHSVISGIYNFHASASAYTQFWNECASINDSFVKISRRQVWQAFIQESIRMVASETGHDLKLTENLNINEVTKEAYSILGNSGIINIGLSHSCAECHQQYRAVADFIRNEDPAALLGADDNGTVPALVGEYAAQSAHETVQARQQARLRAQEIEDNSEMDIDFADVNMIVLDGIVMGPMVKNHLI